MKSMSNTDLSNVYPQEDKGQAFVQKPKVATPSKNKLNIDPQRQVLKPRISSAKKLSTRRRVDPDSENVYID